MKNFTKVICLVLVIAMLALAAASCTPKTPAETTTPAGPADSGKTTEPAETEPAGPVDPYEGFDYPGADADAEEYVKTSAAVYKAALNEFYRVYMAAKAETNVSKKWAMMAIAEAKLMESGVMLPTTTSGGNYAISRVAPYTVDYSLWGNDDENWQTALIATEFIKSADRAEMKAKWGELKGSGTYLSWAKEYLASKGYTLQTTYSTSFSSFPQTWDVLATSRAADSEYIVKTYDGLLEYDNEGIQQPALAESYTVSADGLTYTFKIRNTVWVDSQGREVAKVKADDFVAGLQHAIDAEGGLGYLVDGVVKGIHAYIEKEDMDFTHVGVKATDDNTLVYTLEAPCSYFLTMLGYGIFAPMSRSFYESKGGKFGAEFDASAESYVYGKTQDDIAYCGAFIVKNATDASIVSFEKNESYWNKAAMNIDKIQYLYNDGSDTLKAYNDAKSGQIAGAGLNASALEQAKSEGLFATYGYTTSTDATSYMAFFNINRAAFANVNDGAVVSPQSPEQAARTKSAIQNIHFRRALTMGVDRATYNAVTVGDELKLVSLRNSYTPGTFVYLEEDVTVDINGTSKTYKKGTPYGQIMQDQIDADGVKITVYDPKADDGVGSGDGYDGWYNPANAMEELNAAIAELADLGISKENPIQIDIPYPSARETYTKRAQAYKQSLEAALQGYVQVNLVECTDNAQWLYTGYYTDYGYEANYDIYDLSGWGPDYGDPSTYLDTFLPDGNGYMIKCIGIF